MTKDNDYKNRSVVLPIAITIFIVCIMLCMMVLIGKVMIMWRIKSAYEELGRNSMPSSVQQKSSKEIQLEEKVLVCRTKNMIRCLVLQMQRVNLTRAGKAEVSRTNENSYIFMP
ncbi:hypothetical protein [Streptococcus sanguinis]|uniref:hypothetical protein n=1 Tax=Streptococcus sanguinis TaxID=1305 RepID=UPI001CC0F2A5|nr:hypothetical protein [Streptococcus sanguinis]